jgi:cellobiose phosphorylase
MQIELVDESQFHTHDLRAAAAAGAASAATSGITIRALPLGCIYAIECDGILINQVLASPLAGGIHRIYLRRHDADGTIRFCEVVGPASSSGFAASAEQFVWTGEWEGVAYRCTCRLHASGEAWFFDVQVENRTPEQTLRCDAILVQDIGLATRGQVRNNELFTSQYLDHFAIEDSNVGYLVMSRQNLPQLVGSALTHPWLLQGCFPRGRGLATDGFDFFGAAHRGDGVPVALSEGVIGERIRQYEAGYTAIQSVEVELKPSRSFSWTFFSHFVPDHPEASSPADAQRVERVQAMRNEMTTAPAPPAAAGQDRSVFQTCELFDADDLNENDLRRLFPAEHRHIELDHDLVTSFFHGPDARHVVLKSKELSVARPHGHIMRSGRGMTPDAELMSCAFYAAGVFASQLTLGNTSLGKLLSGVRDSLNLVRSNGLRLFVRHDSSAPWQLLATPSAFEMAVDQCRWIYQRRGDRLTVTCSASDDQPSFTYDVRVEGRPVELLICGEIAAGPAEYESQPRMTVDRDRGTITIRPDQRFILGKSQPNICFEVLAQHDAVEAIGGDELLFADQQSRRLPYFTIRTRATTSLQFTFTGTLGTPKTLEAKNATTPTIKLQLPSKQQQADQIQDTLTWFARDAMVHLSTPRGLEQANGGAWGVRDVCQGSVEFLLAYDRCELVADILRKVFSQQYHGRGDWPQWFMFPPFEEIQSTHCHGDVLIWPLKALCDYLEHSNNGSILHERLPYTDETTFQPIEASRQTILEHVDRLLQRMRQQFLPGVALPRYGEGDWDDSLQPADPLLRERLVSSWTTQLMYQTLRRYADALARFGETSRSESAAHLAEQIRADFQRYLMPDGVVAGFAAFAGDPPRPVEYLLHPSDARTGIHYRLIPMSRGILSGIFSTEQAKQHVGLMHEHLLYPDGARLMDRPTTYTGGTERIFRRSESAAFFGREIGLQYVHAHLRYAEAMAHMGRADELWRAMLVVNPIAVTQVVPGARERQRNCYFSSSDAAFRDRYQASRDYDKLRRGEVATDAGWRIYSSGPGIYTNLVIRHLLGLRRYFDSVEFDPVLPKELAGLSCELPCEGREVRYEFAVKTDSCAVKRIAVNGVPITALTRVEHPYRAGPVRIERTKFMAMLTKGQNIVRLET